MLKKKYKLTAIYVMCMINCKIQPQQQACNLLLIKSFANIETILGVHSAHDATLSWVPVNERNNGNPGIFQYLLSIFST